MPDTTTRATVPTQRDETSPRPLPGPATPPPRQWLARRARAALARRTGAELDRLVRHDPRWRSLPGPALGDGVAVDHLAIGPAGVFALTSSGGSATADHVGERLSAATGIPVRAHLVVVAGAGAGAGADRGTVVHRDRLRSFLHTRPACLAPVTVERLHEAARDQRTWRVDPA